MNRLIFVISIIISVIFSNLTKVNAQISEGGTPPSFTNHLSDSLVDKRIIPSINVKEVMLEDSKRPGPLWAGRSIAVKLNMTNSGTWTALPDGSRIWRLKLTSAGAKAIAVCYDDFYIPEGLRTRIHNIIAPFLKRSHD